MARRRRKHSVRCLGCGHEFSSTKDPRIFSVQCGMCGSRKTVLSTETAEDADAAPAEPESPAEDADATPAEPESPAEEEIWTPSPELESGVWIPTRTWEESITTVLYWLRASPRIGQYVLQTWRAAAWMQTPELLYKLFRQCLQLDDSLARICADYVLLYGAPPWIVVNQVLLQIPLNQRHRQAALWRRMGVPI